MRCILPYVSSKTENVLLTELEPTTKKNNRQFHELSLSEYEMKRLIFGFPSATLRSFPWAPLLIHFHWWYSVSKKWIVSVLCASVYYIVGSPCHLIFIIILSKILRFYLRFTVLCHWGEYINIMPLLSQWFFLQKKTSRPNMSEVMRLKFRREEKNGYALKLWRRHSSITIRRTYHRTWILNFIFRFVFIFIKLLICAVE